MAYRLVTCPETGHLELLEYIDHPVGILVHACSRFRPACAVGCARTCAARLDRRARGTRPDLGALVADLGIGLELELAVADELGDDTNLDMEAVAPDPLACDP